MTLGSIGIASIMFLVFLLDIIIGIPFSSSTPENESSPFLLVDIGGILASLIIAYLGFNAFRDVK